MSKFKDLPDWNQWILQKNADTEMEELNKAPMSGKVSPQRKSTKFTPPSTTVPKKEVKPAPPQGTKEKPVPIGERRGIKVSHEGEDERGHNFGVHKGGKRVGVITKGKHAKEDDGLDMYSDDSMDDMDVDDAFDLTQQHIDKHKEHYYKDKVKKSAREEMIEVLEKAKKKKGRCWTGYKPVPGKKPYEEGSCEPVEKAEKPFIGYNAKKHAKSGGLNDKYREKYNREHGSNLQRPSKDKDNPRRKSFCARMSGVKGPTSKDGKLTRKGAALKRWNC